MSDTIVTRDLYPNYSGMLFRKGNASAPFSSMIGAPEITNHNKFAIGVMYDAQKGEQPAISENASVKAPDATAVGRTQQYNVTQIFQYSVNVSYAKQSDMGTLSGINVAGAAANPPDELDFQVAQKLAKAQADMEYSFIRGTYAEATNADTASKTRGLLEAITTNKLTAGASKSTPAALSFWKVAEALEAISGQGGATDNLVLGVSGAALLQLNKDIAENQYVQGITNIGGINVKQVITPFGNINLALIPTLNAVGEEKDNTAVIFNPAMMHPVYQPVPGKGNFFLEELAKVGASEHYQLFGQVGLDYGAEFYCAKIEGISNDKPTGTL